ncbi:MAG: DUF2283 domain-containing protein [Patescibacteria group bacterium]|nr:DUF2283 domain-containing protein [Patescibacteria group bacterium]MBU1160477.1 DUF2283 domain-containing protein [Patescibacteria group bacterium]MBU1349923.1 DUF2283 domain-containing protein [Patescibacteria group bacterium]MBU1421282.1 DUF2283 domain-containing protein [Patescibacteria group bacterium]MBU1683949.1 DUF2283 domain-containing protein [Patescibacteria group bacterium]
MEKIKIYYDSFGNTLNIWFDKPEKEHIAEETGNEIILVKDKKGKVIGFEKLNFLSPKLLANNTTKSLPVELIMS